MKQQKVFDKIERLVREQEIMEKRYNINVILLSEPIFTTSQETDVWELISEGLSVEEIIKTIKKW